MEREKLRVLLERSVECASASVPQLQEWLEEFSKSVKSKAEDLQVEVEKLSDDTSSVEQDLKNIFNSFRLLSNTQFIENRVYEEDETLVVKQGESEEQRRAKSYEDDILPRYKEAVILAWSAHEQASKSSRTREAKHRQLPYIIGSEEFMHDPYGGLPDPRAAVSSSEVRDYDSETEKDGVNMAAEMVGTGVLSDGEWSEASHLDEQDDHEPAVSAALDFKAMLEAALRGTYVPYDDGLKREVNALNRKSKSASTNPNIGDSEKNAAEEIPAKDVDGHEATFHHILGKITQENAPEYTAKTAEKSLNPPSTADHLLSNITLLRQPDLDRSSSATSSWSSDGEEDTQIVEDTRATEDHEVVHDDAPASESVEAPGHVTPGRHEDEEEADIHSMLTGEATETQTETSPGFDKDRSVSDSSMSSKQSVGDGATSSDSSTPDIVRTSVSKPSLQDAQQAVAAFRSSTLSTLLFGDEEEDEGDALFGPVGSVKIG